MTTNISPCAEYEQEITALINQQNADMLEIERLKELADNQARKIKKLEELVDKMADILKTEY